MLYWAFLSLVVAVISSVFGSAGVPAAAAAIARVVFFIAATGCLAAFCAVPLRRSGFHT